MKKFKIFFTAVALTLSALSAVAQNITVSGTVKDEAGDPIVGANVILAGSTTVYDLTGMDGSFKISVPGNGTLVVSSLGFVEQQIPVNGRTALNIVLESDSQMLDETIVVAFGTATKESFTGSAKVVNSEQLSHSQVSAVTSALTGQVAGVQTTVTGGAPGSTPAIRIRGFSSISAGNAPLYVVDGMPYDGDINNINPNDVESMTVLKDAASNALYGARGANGVIIITTKRSKERDAVITLDAKVGVNSNALLKYDMISDPAMYYETHYKALYDSYINGGASAATAWARANGTITGPAAAGGLGYQVYSVPDGQYFIGSNGKINPAATLGNKVTYQGQEFLLLPDDWEKAGFRNSLRQEYNLSVSGGGDKSNIYASVGYLNNQGVTYNSDMQRLTARLRADYQAKPWVKFSGNVSYTNFNYNSLSGDGGTGDSGNIWAYTAQMAPIYPLLVRDGEGKQIIDQNGIALLDYGDGEMNAGLTRPFLPNNNALLANKLNTRNSEGNAFTASGAADFTFLKYFKFTVNTSFALDETRGTTVLNPYYGQFVSSGGSVSKSHSRSTNLNTQQLLNYTQSFGLHTVSAMLGHEWYDSKYAYLGAGKRNMFSQSNKELAGAVVDSQSANSYTTEYNNEGYFIRAQYDYDNKIFASASFRRDASSRFHPDHRWGNFWSVGAAWIISKEKWFTASWVDMLKLKASYGSQGNDNIGSYMYTDTYNIVPSDGNIAVTFDGKGKRDITWETNRNFNVGAEFTLLKGILDGSVEYFNRTTTNMLFAFTVAPSLGYTSYYDNVGDMRNQGVELSLTANIFNKKDLRWSVTANATKVMNKILYLHDDVKTLNVDGYDGYNNGTYFYGQGLPLYTRYLKKYAGVDPQTGESLWWKKNLDADGNVESEEKTNNYSSASYYLGDNSIPKWYGGFGTSFYWKGLDFAINFSYQIGGKAYDSGYAALMSPPTAGNTGTNFHVDVLKSWTADKPSDTIPRFVYGDVYTAYTSDRFMTDASYLNIENVNLGYTFPAKWTRKIGIQSLRLYVACENVFYWSVRRGFDPRSSFSGGSSFASYLPVRTLSGGITFKF